MRRLYVHQRSDGCIESFLDFARSRAALEAGGWTLCTHPEEADLVLVNTCIVGEIVEQHCVEDIRSLRQRMRPEAELVVTGCMPDYNADSLARLGVSFMFSPRKIDLFLERYQLTLPEEVETLEPEYLGPYNLFNWVTRLLRSAADRRLPLPEHLYRRFGLIEDRDMHFLRIARGCVERCTFCATKFATGRLLSVPQEMVIQRFDVALASGKRNFALCGEDTGAWGADLGTSLPALLREMLKRRKDFVISIRQHQPNWLIAQQEAYLEVLSDSRVKSLTIPFQSGSDAVLSRMGRRYTAQQVESAIRAVHRTAPHVVLRTHVIAGFPGETRADFKATCRLVSSLPWDMVLVFPYTDRPRTRAAGMEPKVPLAEIQRRTWVLNLLVGRRVLLNDFRFLPLVRSNPLAPARVFEE